MVDGGQFGQLILCVMLVEGVLQLSVLVGNISTVTKCKRQKQLSEG